MAANLHRPRVVAILGAGCAGTLLAAELRRRRFAGRLELIDARTDFSREQRWCFWRQRGRVRELEAPIDAEWSAWQVADGQKLIRCTSRSHAYSHVYAPEFFRRFHGRLAEDPQADLHLGCRVEAVRRRRGGTYGVQTSGGELGADVVIDTRHEGATAYQRVTLGSSGLLWQTFRGRVVQFAEPRFDPTAVTLMDFRVPTLRTGLAFVYVLPFSETRALVEAVVLSHAQAAAPKLDAILDTYLEEQFGEIGDTIAVEKGELPMTPRSFAASDVGGVISLGVGGGAARPSSGYAFANIMRTVQQTADALCENRLLRQPKFAWKYRALDTLFLRLLRVDPDAARHAFAAMFAGMEADRLVRFLTEASSWRDDLALGMALPKAAFLEAMLPRPSRKRLRWMTTAS